MTGKHFAEDPSNEKPVVPPKKLKTEDLGKNDSNLASSSSPPKGRLYCFGTNDGGQLGFECDDEGMSFPCPVPSLKEKRFVAVACGGMHTLALEEDGSVWSFGVNDDQALGRVTEELEDEMAPGKVAIPEKVVQISAGDSHSAALTEDGVVYAWGCFKDRNGNYGLVADEREVTNGQDEDMEVDNEDRSVGIRRQELVMISAHLKVKIAKIASGSHNIAMLGEDGQLYTCGTPCDGQLDPVVPVLPEETRNERLRWLTPAPVTLEHNPKIRDLWTGEFSTYCVSETGEFYVCGLNNHGQLGINIENTIAQPTTENSFNAKAWQKIAAGMHHTVALDDQGKVYTLGRNVDGQLGLGPELTYEVQQYFEVPQMVPGLADKTCIFVAAGGSTSYAVTTEGHLYAWGFGENLQLATGDDNDRWVPTRCKENLERNILGRVEAVDAGGQHVALIISGVD